MSDIRSEFEALLRTGRNHKPCYLDRWRDGTYRFKAIEDAWQGFQAGYEAAQAKKED